MHELVAIFIDDAGKNIEKLQSMTADSDPAEMQRLAHTLKGSAANISARQLRDAASALENALKAGVHDDLPGLINRIADAYNTIRERLKN